MEAVNEGMIKERKEAKIKATDVMNILVILFLSCVIIIFSALVTDMVIRMTRGTPYTVVYNTKIVEEEPKVLSIQF